MEKLKGFHDEKLLISYFEDCDDDFFSEMALKTLINIVASLPSSSEKGDLEDGE